MAIQVFYVKITLLPAWMSDDNELFNMIRQIIEWRRDQNNFAAIR